MKTPGARVLAGRAGAAIALLVISLVLVGYTAVAVPRYEIDVDVNWDEGTFAGVTRVTIENTTQTAIDELVFRLFANDSGIYGDASVRVLEASTTDETIALEVQSDATTLPLVLPTPLAVGQTTSVALRFEGIAASSPFDAPPESTGYGILTKNPASLVLTAFYPMLAVDGDDPMVPSCSVGDRLWGEAADYAVTLRTTRAVTPAATGRLLSSVDQDGLAVHHFQADSARDFSLVLMQGYEEGERQWGGVTLRSHFLPANRSASERTLMLAYEAFELFESAIGLLPFREIEIVSVPLHRAAGVEFTGLILVSELHAQQPDDLLYDIILSHEMAHQWFYSAVGNDPVSEPWLDESLATFLSNLFIQQSRGTEDALRERLRWQGSYQRAQRAAPTMEIDRPACAFGSSSIYSGFVYDGGAWFLHNVRDEIGDEAFFAALRVYYAANTGGIGRKSSLLASFEDACACDLSDLYRAFGLSPK